MQWIPPFDPQRYHLGPLLAARGIDPAWLADNNLDAYSPANIARYSITKAAEVIPFRYRTAIVDQPAVLAWCQELTDQARTAQKVRRSAIATVQHGPSLLLLGLTGTGKTHQAYAAIREIAVTGVAATWAVTTAADMYAALRPRHGIDAEAEFRRYRDASILLVDDLGAERKPTEFTEEINFRLINWRYERQLPTLLTSNLLPKEISARLGDRVTSRLIEMCERVVIDGPDRRRGEAA